MVLILIEDELAALDEIDASEEPDSTARKLSENKIKALTLYKDMQFSNGLH